MPADLRQGNGIRAQHPLDFAASLADLSPMTPAEIHAFAHRLMQEVWEPFDSSRLAAFYQPDVLGHHRGQLIRFRDIENRLAWDRRHRANQRYDIRDIIAESDRFAIRFVFTTHELPAGERSEIEVIYFYHLRDGRIAEFWLLAGIDFDYLEPAEPENG